MTEDQFDHDYIVHTLNLLFNDLGGKCDVPVAYGLAIGRMVALQMSCCDHDELRDDDEYIRRVNSAFGYTTEDCDEQVD